MIIETEGLGPQRFHGKIVMLVNEHSRGGSEMVAKFAQDNELAKIVGTRPPVNFSAGPTDFEGVTVSRYR